MENATKALLIAASVLIAIVLISIGLKILSSTSGVTDKVGEVSTTMEATITNSQFTMYEGKNQRASVAIELANKVKTYNSKYTDRIIAIKYIPYNDGVEQGYIIQDIPKFIDHMRNDVVSGTIEIKITEYYNDGYIKTIQVDAQKQEK